MASEGRKKPIAKSSEKNVVMQIMIPKLESSRMSQGMRQTDEPNDVTKPDRMLWPTCSTALCRRPARSECCEWQ